DFHQGPVVEVALIWPHGAGGERLQPLLDEVFGRYLPNRVAVGAADGDRTASTGIPLLETRPAVQGKPTAYLCQRYVCQAPTTDPAELARQIREA
ncbi:MAG: thioredoxin domain-containing protein, partial [candidate division NC10 bacterium]